MGLYDSLFDSNSSCPSSSSCRNSTNGSDINLDSVRSLLNSRTSTLKSTNITESDFYSGWGDPSEIKEPFELGLDAKRHGDLASANQYFCECFKKSESFYSPFIWSWCKVMILAKNWECLRDLLEYHFVMMVTWNRLMKKKGNQEFFFRYEAMNMVPHFDYDEFHAGEHLRDQVHSPLIDRNKSIERLSQFGGSPYWEAKYTISESEWREFQQVFPLPNL